MPDQPPMTPGAQAILRARGLLDRGVNALRNFAGRQWGGLRNALPGTENHDWRQTLDAATNTIIPGNWYDSQTGHWQNPLTGRDTRWGPGRPQPPGAPSWMQPNAPMPENTAQPWQPPAVPGQQPQGQGPLRSYARPPGRAQRGGTLRGTTMETPLGIDTPANQPQNPWTQFFARREQAEK